MAKNGVSAISGVTAPVVGEKQIYNIVSWYPSTPDLHRNPAKVTWELFKKRSSGKFTSTNIKKIGRSDFTFGQAAAGETYRLEAYLYEPEGGGLIITPKPAKIPRINKVELFYVDDTKGILFSFMDKLRARANCVNMLGKELLFTLWEDDAKGRGHNSKNSPISTQKARVDINGLAAVDFSLSPLFMLKAARGEQDSKLEFYVTVEYFKDKKHATNNIDVKNPYPKVPISPPKKSEPTKQVIAKGSPADDKPASKKEENGIWDSISETVAKKDGELWDYAESAGTAIKDKVATSAIIEEISPAIINAQSPADSTFCGEKYCIKKKDPKSELIREINIRLAGFGGNVPTDEFTERTEKMVKQFQRDYMKVPETGKVCGNVLRAIDEFQTKFSIDFTELKCKCGTCSGYGDGTNKGKYLRESAEAYHKYEYPGIHRSLLSSLRSVTFYLAKDGRYSFNKINSGYRCRFHPEYLKKPTTNHMGKALDLHFNTKNGRTREISDMETIRMDIFNKFLGAKWDWKEGNIFNLESTRVGATTWVHYDVREFDSDYLNDKYFVKSLADLNGKSIFSLALEAGFIKTCSCNGQGNKSEPAKAPATVGSCEDKFKKVAPVILRHEGGYVNDPDDSGGETNKGITMGTFKTYAKEDLGIEPTSENLKNITDEQATTIYRKRYWEPKGFCKIEDDKVSLMIYDWTITSGGAAKKIQQLLIDDFAQTITADGGIGDDTINAINSVEDQDKLLVRLGEIRKDYYTNLAIKDGKKTKNYKFLNGWINRVDDCLNIKL